LLAGQKSEGAVARGKRAGARAGIARLRGRRGRIVSDSFILTSLLQIFEDFYRPRYGFFGAFSQDEVRKSSSSNI